MAELRKVDPTTLLPNPDDPRRTAAPRAMEEQLIASIRAIGIIQPPRVKQIAAGLMLVAGARRTKAAIAVGLTEIDVLVCDPEEAIDAMRSVSENLIRAGLTSVDIWRAIECLEKQGWNEQAIADALALPVRTVKRLKLLASVHPPMLEHMAAGSMPNEDQLRTISAAPIEEQVQVWKKQKPKKGQAVEWYAISRALQKQRIPFSAAKFGADLTRAYGITWQEDLFAQGDEDGRYTTNVEAFFGAQREWMQNNMPGKAVVLTCNEHGHYQLPKKAQEVYCKAGPKDVTGYYIDLHSAAVKTVVYRMPEPKKTTKSPKAGIPSDITDDNPTSKSRAGLTQKGMVIIGDMRTDALHKALREVPINDHTVIALLVLALGARNVSVQSGTQMGTYGRERLAATITEGGVITSDHAILINTAREMLTSVLSCRENMTNSGLAARIAGAAVEADAHLPTMATEQFLSCLSKPAIEAVAHAEGVGVQTRGKDTRAAVIERFKSGTYVYPGALFQLTDEELAQAKEGRDRRSGLSSGWSSDEGPESNGADDLAANTPDGNDDDAAQGGCAEAAD